MPNCYWARCGLQTMEQEFGADRILWVEEHVAQGLYTPEVLQRASWYGVVSFPYVRIDGSRGVQGASSCEQAAASYRTKILERLAETEGMSPVEIEGTFTRGPRISIGASFRLVDPVVLTDLQATFFVVEDSVLYEGEIWPRVVRDICLEPVALSQPGDVAFVQVDIPSDPDWTSERLYVLAFLQQTSGEKPILQGERFAAAAPWAELDAGIRSVPDGSGAAIFRGRVWNRGESADTFTVDLEPFGDWWVEVQVGDDPAWRVPPVEVVLEPRDSVSFQLGAHTGATREVRTAKASVASQLALATQWLGLRLFNGSWSILLVDDDGYRLDEAAIEEGILDAGLLHDSWDVYHDPTGAPSAAEMHGYDVVLWQTGLPLTDPVLTAEEMASMRGYADRGGSVLLTSQQHLNDSDLDPEFTGSYLGVAGRLLDLGYAHMAGVAGDPIGDGLDLRLSLASPLNRSDGVVPGPTARAFLLSPEGDGAAVRNERADGARVVFLPWALHALAAGADPDNIGGVIRRCVEWLMRRSPAEADGEGLAGGSSRLLAVRPNPARGAVEIEFDLSGRDARAPVTLQIFDLLGRRVGIVCEEVLAPGLHARTWDPGVSLRAKSGLYLVRLSTRSATACRKLLLLPGD